MKTYFGTENLDAAYPAQTVVAIGNFDGVHLGHEEILKRADALAKSLGCQMVCFTFNPHPTHELRPEIPLRLLMTYDEKRRNLQNYHVAFCVEERFDANFAKNSAQDFFQKILKDRLHAVGVVVGQDFAFGKKREGKIETLREFCKNSNTALEVVAPVLIAGEIVSSSRIRNALAEGKVELANQLLGRPFSYSGEVIHGDKRGRTIGFPTANMKCEEKFPVKPGVYATSVFWRGQEFASVTNIGTRPTFNVAGLKMETHILDRTFELYGEILEIRFHAAIRDEKKFASIDELKAQIQADTILAKKLLSTRNF
jgi:riboflavin kinase/FMN adenylyltransferase